MNLGIGDWNTVFINHHVIHYIGNNVPTKQLCFIYVPSWQLLISLIHSEIRCVDLFHFQRSGYIWTKVDYLKVDSLCAFWPNMTYMILIWQFNWYQSVVASCCSNGLLIKSRFLEWNFQLKPFMKPYLACSITWGPLPNLFKLWPWRHLFDPVPMTTCLT